ncbi:MAG: fibronectin type III domain-containing protein, partial [Proteobacteria bacterium]|nr:fibronectin type III domain-containing protein [Pseudomonadota bacterium]
MKKFFFQPPGPSYIDLPPAPQNVTLIVDDGQVTISWDSVIGATSYNIYWNTTGSVTTSDSQIVTLTSPYDHTGLVNGTTYYYIVTAINSIGEGALSSEVSAIPSTNLSDASLNGTYLMNGRDTSLNTSSTAAWKWNNEVTFDGAGGCSYIGLIEKGIIRDDTSGALREFTGTPDDGVCTYSLASDGTLTVDGSPTYAVSPDANIIFGSYAESSIIEAMVKQSSGLNDASLNGTYL